MDWRFPSSSSFVSAQLIFPSIFFDFSRRMCSLCLLFFSPFEFSFYFPFFISSHACAAAIKSTTVLEKRKISRTTEKCGSFFFWIFHVPKKSKRERKYMKYIWWKTVIALKDIAVCLRKPSQRKVKSWLPTISNERADCNRNMDRARARGMN